VAEYQGRQKRIPCDHVLAAVGFKRTDTTDLEDRLSQESWEVIKIGPLRGAGRFMDVIHSGYWAALEV
jgi:hypothetical protein